MKHKLSLERLLLFVSALGFIFIPAFDSHTATVTHTYDDLNRIERSEYSDGTVIIYKYDEVGNRERKRVLYKPHLLTLQVNGGDYGSVTSAPAGISCGTKCEELFSEGTAITLTASPNTCMTFTGWSGGGCSGTGTCSVTISDAATVTATFTPNPPVTLAASPLSGNSPLIVSFTDNSMCATAWNWNFGDTENNTSTLKSPTHTYNKSGIYTITLTADSSSGSTTITKSNLINIAGLLTVVKAGHGTGKITSNTGGIDCGGSCSATYAKDTTVTLTAMPDPCMKLAAWTGACSGAAASCSVAMTESKNVTATFSYIQPTANFTPVSQQTGTAPFQVAFTDASTCATSWSWNFGDSDPNNTNTSTAQNPTPHTYRKPGTYTVALVASNPDGSSTNTQTGLIFASPCYNFPAKIGDTYYGSLTEAITAAASGATIKALAVDLNGSVSVNKSLILNGGYDCYYSSTTTGPTAIGGNVAIENGTFNVTMDGIKVN